jgi:tRNA(fMet)-specific endonuclease VapC
VFLLDTNIVSKLLKQGELNIQRHFQRAEKSGLAVSSITTAELRCGIVKRGLETTRLGSLVDAFLVRVTILPWTVRTALHFARLRADSEADGVTVDMLDLMIATHAHEDPSLTLVTNDGALLKLKPWIKTVDWTK